MNVLKKVFTAREKCFKERCTEKDFFTYMQCLSKVESKDIDIQYSLLLETNVIEIRNPKAIYDNYYLDKKKMMEKIALIFQNDKKSSLKKVSKKIAIYTNTWRDKNYSIGIVVATMAKEFIKQGYDVEVFVENQFIHNEKLEDILCPELFIDSEKFSYMHKKMLNDKCKVHYNKGKSIKERIENHINDIIEFRPEFVFDLSDENSCCSRILYDIFPIIYFPMRSNHGSSAFFHKYLAADTKKMKKVLEKYHCFDENLLEEVVTGFTEYPLAKEKYDRKLFSFNNSDFLMVTVGNRLCFDMDKSWIKNVEKILRRNPKYKWILVGKEVPNSILSMKDELEDQIVLHGYEQDLVALYKLCDIYLNPIRKGGGLSIAWAMHEGLPIVTFHIDSDALSWVGEEITVSCYDEMQAFIEKLEKDKEFYSLISSKMKKRALDKSPAKCVQQIILIMEKMR